MRVLIIEDERAIAALFQDQFEHHHHTVQLAESAEEGATLIKRERPDVVILDLKLPGAQGLELLQQLKADPHLKNIPVVVVSGMVDRDERQAATGMGAAQVLHKTTITPNQLVKIAEGLVPH